MELKTDLLILASLLGYTVAFPLQVNETTNGTVASNELEKDIFSLLIEANKDIRFPLKDIDIHLNIGRNTIYCPSSSCFWPKSSDGRVRVPYILSSIYDDDQRTTFSASMKEFATMTCVDFVPRRMESDYLNIVSEIGCSSYIGQIGNVQKVILNTDTCITKGIIDHELMHNLGFYHEQSRPDRDNYIKIMWQYINARDKGNLAIEKTANTLGLPYDYNSVMHYGSTVFSNTSGQDTIIPKYTSTAAIGQRYGLSNLDVAKINRLYNCSLCRTLLTGSWGRINVTQSTSLLPNGGSCIWLIRIPANKVSLLISNFNIQYSSGCQSNYLRVYDGNSKTSPIILDKQCRQGQNILVWSSGENILVEFVYSGPIGSQYVNAIYKTVPV